MKKRDVSNFWGLFKNLKVFYKQESIFFILIENKKEKKSVSFEYGLIRTSLGYPLHFRLEKKNPSLSSSTVFFYFKSNY